MSQLPALASRQPASNTLAGQQPSRTGSGATGLAGSSLMQRTAQDVVALSKNGLDLSAKGLSQRTDALGNATVDVAQDFLNNMTRQLFGDGATVAFDSVDLQAGSSFSSGSVSGAGGSSRAAAFSLDENAHFIGKGKITTADGQTFDFEVEVQYQSNISAGMLEQTQNAAEEAGSADDTNLPAKELPATHFAGNLHDLFKLLGQQLQSHLYQGSADDASASGKDGDLAGSLSLRLLKLVQPDTAVDAVKEEQARARALALAYGTDTANSTASNV
ncbi:hypothetical protein [Janthinobacterium sp. NKUCC06_STL]|uniref:hypothetical protein n=1 Tax=Janthinobacterium sp. NKUCC06_STL TaxID=2842127 RepID=UPI001C5B457E|nr:hypothetical protein [Janthinobacterium sp. NKUCC06_STL]MBW3512637.1 hypothetical protein [Janthinobacterium sp. NKUCC06_STL]